MKFSCLADFKEERGTVHRRNDIFPIDQSFGLNCETSLFGLHDSNFRVLQVLKIQGAFKRTRAVKYKKSYQKEIGRLAQQIETLDEKLDRIIKQEYGNRFWEICKIVQDLTNILIFRTY